MIDIVRFNQDMDGEMEASACGRWVHYDDVVKLFSELPVLPVNNDCGCADQRECTGACCNNDAADAQRYRWLAAYFIGDSNEYDDALVAAKTRQEMDDVIDDARKQGEMK